MRSDAATVEEYLAGLPEDRRAAIAAVRGVVRANLPDGYQEVMGYGMITWVVPLATYPDTYNGKPFMYAALASQKRHMAIYLTAVYADEGRRTAFVEAWRATGKRLDMGKSCARFKRLEDVPLDVVAESIAGTSVAELLSLARR